MARLFSDYCVVKRVVMKPGQASRYCFVWTASVAQAVQAKGALDGTLFRGNFLQVNHAKERLAELNDCLDLRGGVDGRMVAFETGSGKDLVRNDPWMTAPSEGTRTNAVTRGDGESHPHHRSFGALEWNSSLSSAASLPLRHGDPCGPVAYQGGGYAIHADPSFVHTTYLSHPQQDEESYHQSPYNF